MDAAIILAAGKGDKLWPFNEVRQKCAFPIGNRPVVRRLAESLIAQGMRRLAVVVGPGEASVRHALHGLEPEPLFVRQPTAPGSAPAALAAWESLGPGDVLVAYGDVVTTEENTASVIASFNSERPAACVLLALLGREDSGDWICGGLGSDGSLTGVQGHPRGGRHRLGGVFAFREDTAGALRDNPGLLTSVPVGGMPPMEADLAASLQLLIDDHLPVLAVESTGFLVDLDRPWHIVEANDRLLEHEASRLTEDSIHPSARVDDSAEIRGRLVLGENAVIGARAIVNGALWLGPGASVTNGSIIGGRAHLAAGARVRDYALVSGGSSLGAGSLVGHGGEFGGVMLERAFLYHYCEISGVVGAAVDIGAATVCGTLRFDDRDQTHLIRGRRETPAVAASTSCFGDYSRTGVNAIIMPGCKIGPYACVGPGVVLSEDLPARTLVQVQQTLTRKAWGPEKYGW